MYECHAGKWIMLKGRHFISLLICSVYELFSINFPRRVNLIWLQGKTSAECIPFTYQYKGLVYVFVGLGRVSVV